MAKVAYDCHVTAICSSKNAAYAKKLGADEVIDYTTKDVVQTLLSERAANKESDLIVDCVGGTELLSHYVGCLSQIPNHRTHTTRNNSSTQKEHT